MFFAEVLGDFERGEADAFCFELVSVVDAEESVFICVSKVATPFEIESSRSFKESFTANGYRIADANKLSFRRFVRIIISRERPRCPHIVVIEKFRPPCLRVNDVAVGVDEARKLSLNILTQIEYDFFVPIVNSFDCFIPYNLNTAPRYTFGGLVYSFLMPLEIEGSKRNQGYVT